MLEPRNEEDSGIEERDIGELEDDSETKNIASDPRRKFSYYIFKSLLFFCVRCRMVQFQERFLDGTVGKLSCNITSQSAYFLTWKSE